MKNVILSPRQRDVGLLCSAATTSSLSMRKVMNFRQYLIITGLGLCVSPTIGAAENDPIRQVAVDPQAAAFTDLYQSGDNWLQSALQEKLNDIGLAKAASRGQLAVALVDITDPSTPRMASINGDQAMYAASLPKIAILLGAFHKAQAGEMDLDASARESLTRMIRSSSNADATLMLERVGYDYLADVLQSDGYKLYDPEQNGGLWVGKPYARKGAWKRDPLHNLSHAATPFEVARFYYLLETGQLVSPGDCDTMKEMLSKPAIRHKFVRGLDKHRPGSEIFRKSGTWRSYHADSAIVERDGRRYIAVALANSESGGKWLADLIVGMDEIIHHPDNIIRDRQMASSNTRARSVLSPLAVTTFGSKTGAR